jgi:hypothetical protein
MLSVQERISMKEVCAITGRSLQAVHRWCKIGVAGVRLRSEMSGLLRYTTRPWLEEFTSTLSQTKGCISQSGQPAAKEVACA